MATASENQPRPAAEAPLEPNLPICDPHHHLRERPNDRYFLEEFIQDTSTGHNIVATVCVENRAMYRKDGPETMKPIGETEFFDSVAVQAASDPNNSTRVAAAIVGHADLSLGEAVAQVLEAHLTASPNRFRGIRHSTTWDESEAIRSDARPGLLADSAFRRGFRLLAALRPELRRLALSSTASGARGAGARLSKHEDCSRSHRGAAGCQGPIRENGTRSSKSGARGSRTYRLVLTWR